MKDKYLTYKFIILIFSILLAILILGISIYSIIKISFEQKQSASPHPFSATSTPSSSTSEPPLFPYIEIIESCGPYYAGTCVNMRSGPGTEYPVVKKLRTGIVLRVADIVKHNEQTWYKIAFDESLRYPDRVQEDWYVAADVVHLFYDDGDHRYTKGISPPTKKRIIVDLSDETLYAYDDNELFMKETVSTGIEFAPTPRGKFIVYKMTPSRYMQGPIPGISTDYYDLPGVPWNLYFTQQGAVIHGAYWHDKFGQPWSHGCVNLPSQKAKELYLWADIGTTVTVQD